MSNFSLLFSVVVLLLSCFGTVFVLVLPAAFLYFGRFDYTPDVVSGYSDV